MNKYQEWIDINYPTESSAYGQCQEACESMQKSFPELIITNGFVDVPAWSTERTHWWLKDLNGKIIDPTRSQFPGLIEYKEASADADVRNYERSRCHNCGEYYYLKDQANATVCSDACGDQYIAYIMKSMR